MGSPLEPATAGLHKNVLLLFGRVVGMLAIVFLSAICISVGWLIFRTDEPYIWLTLLASLVSFALILLVTFSQRWRYKFFYGKVEDDINRLWIAKINLEEWRSKTVVALARDFQKDFSTIDEMVSHEDRRLGSSWKVERLVTVDYFILLRLIALRARLEQGEEKLNVEKKREVISAINILVHYTESDMLRSYENSGPANAENVTSKVVSEFRRIVESLQ